MKRIKVWAIGASAVVAAMLPLSASATATPPTPPEAGTVMTANGAVVKVSSTFVPQVAYRGPGQCSHAWVRINAHSITLRQWRSTTAPAVATLVFEGDSEIWGCRWFQVGEIYRDVCGATNTGWILISAVPLAEVQGWIPNQCTEDPIL